MNDSLIDQAKEELKRADHSIYISLKYTRTVDIIKSVITRLINAADFAILQLLYQLKEKKKIPEIPIGVRPRADVIAGKFTQYKQFIQFYYLLRDISKASFTRKEEYKKNVALVMKMRNEMIEINIERLKEYYMTTMQFVTSVHELVAS